MDDAGLVYNLYSRGPKGLSLVAIAQEKKKKPVGSSDILQLERVTRQNNRRRHHHHHHHLLYYNNAPVLCVILCGIVEKGFSLFLLELFNSFFIDKKKKEEDEEEYYTLSVIFSHFDNNFLLPFPLIFYCPLSAGARKNQDKRREREKNK